jgi:dihydrofolate reductase
MRKIVAGEYITLDGVVEAGWAGHKPALAPGDELAGSYFDEEVGQTIGALTAAADTLLLGRVTYEGFAAFFSGQTGGMADQMNNLPKVVVSSTLDKAEWQDSTVVSGDLTGEISRLKQQPGKNIAVSGSATLVRWLLRNRLLDELPCWSSRSCWAAGSACSRTAATGCGSRSTAPRRSATASCISSTSLPDRGRAAAVKSAGGRGSSRGIGRPAGPAGGANSTPGKRGWAAWPGRWIQAWVLVSLAWMLRPAWTIQALRA